MLTVKNVVKIDKMYLGLPLLMRIKAHITIQDKAMLTPTMMPVMDLWSMW